MSPDGKTIAYVGYTKTDTNHVMELWTMSADGSNATLQSAGVRSRIRKGIKWAPQTAARCISRRRIAAAFISTRGRGAKEFVRSPDGAGSVASPTVGKGAIAAVRSSFREPGNVVLLNERRPESVQQLTHLNDELLREVPLANAEEIWYDSSGGAKIQGWIVKPPDFDPARHYPLLLEIHGGPQGMYNVGFSPQFQNFAANGYVVLFTNPRGSTGYGTAFGDAILKHYPGPDYDDLMAGVDAVLKKGMVDESALVRLGLQRRRRFIELDDHPHESFRGGRGSLSGDRLDQHGGRNRRTLLHLSVLQEAVLGRPDRLAGGIFLDACRQCEDPDAAS